MSETTFDFDDMTDEQLFSIFEEIKLRYNDLHFKYQTALLKIHKEEQRHRDKNKRRYDKLKAERQKAILNNQLNP